MLIDRPLRGLSFVVFILISLMTIAPTPIQQDIAQELALREQFLERTRSQRVTSAQALIQSAFPPPVLKTVSVLYPCVLPNGKPGFRKVSESREVPVQL